MKISSTHHRTRKGVVKRNPRKRVAKVPVRARKKLTLDQRERVLRDVDEILWEFREKVDEDADITDKPQLMKQASVIVLRELNKRGIQKGDLNNMDYRFLDDEYATLQDILRDAEYFG